MSRTAITIEIAHETISNVVRTTSFFIRDVEHDPDIITGRMPPFAMQIAAILQSVGRPGVHTLFEVTRLDGQDAATNSIGSITMADDGAITWQPAGAYVEGRLLASLEEVAFPEEV